MRRWVAATAFLCSIGILPAQNWTVGSPVNRTIIDYPSMITVTSFCDSLNPVNGQDAEWVIALPPVTGVDYYLYVDDATSSSHAYKFRQGTNVQILSLGDSMLLASTGAYDTIHVGYAGYQSEVSVRFKAIGIPTVAGELHPCGSTNDGWWNQPVGCLDRNWPDSQTYLVNCEVQAVVGIMGTNADDLRVWPVPAQDHLRLNAVSEAAEMRLYDGMGRCVISIKAVTGEQLLSVGDWPRGIYGLQVLDEKGRRIATRKVILD